MIYVWKISLLHGKVQRVATHIHIHKNSQYTAYKYCMWFGVCVCDRDLCVSMDCFCQTRESRPSNPPSLFFVLRILSCIVFFYRCCAFACFGFVLVLYSFLKNRREGGDLWVCGACVHVCTRGKLTCNLVLCRCVWFHDRALSTIGWSAQCFPMPVVKLFVYTYSERFLNLPFLSSRTMCVKTD